MKRCFHPMANSATMGLSPDDLLKFVRSTDHDPIVEDIKYMSITRTDLVEQKWYKSHYK